jgi:hypothetical protein
MSYLGNFSLLDAYLSARGVGWLDPSDPVTVGMDGNYVKMIYNKSVRGNPFRVRKDNIYASSDAVHGNNCTINDYTNNKNQQLKYVSLNGNCYLASNWDFSYENNTVYCVFRVAANGANHINDSIIAHANDWQYCALHPSQRSGAAGDFRGSMQYLTNSGTVEKAYHNKMSYVKTSGFIDPTVGWHLLKVKFFNGDVYYSIDNGAETISTVDYLNPDSPDWLDNKTYNLNENIMHNKIRYRSKQNGSFNREPSITNTTYWAQSLMLIGSNRGTAKYLKMDCGELICIPTSADDQISNYLINKWDIVSESNVFPEIP